MPNARSRRSRRLKAYVVPLAFTVAFLATPSAGHADFWSWLWNNFVLFCGGNTINCTFFDNCVQVGPCPAIKLNPAAVLCPQGCFLGKAQAVRGLGCKWAPDDTGSCGYWDESVDAFGTLTWTCRTCDGRAVPFFGYEALPPDTDAPTLVETSPATFITPDDEIVLRFAEPMDPNFVILGGDLGAEADPDYRWSRGARYNTDLTLRPGSAWTPAPVSSLTLGVRDASENEVDLDLQFRVRDRGFFDRARGTIDAKAASLGFAPTVISQAPLAQVALGFKKDFPDGLSIYLDDGATEAFEVHGAIHQVYLQTGGPAGSLGFPTSDELATGPFGINRISHFECGSIWWLAFTGATGVDPIPGCVP